MVLAMLGRFEEILSEQHRRAYVYQAFQLDLRFSIALAACAVAPTRGARERRHLRGVARRHGRALDLRARVNADARHLVLALRAELSALDGDAALTLELYADASARARAIGYVHHAALILERKMNLLLGMGSRVDADLARQECAALYEAWGARGKAERVRSAQPWS